MKKNITCIAQGDILFIPVETSADGKFHLEGAEIGTVETIQPKDGRLVVGHSETGHHHYVAPTQMNPAVLFTTNRQFVSLLKAEKPVTVKHDRAWDTHGEIKLPAGDWAVIKQRERRPNQWIAAKD
jgi:hypothetical protein